jgi:hypothetical protein
VGDVVDVSKAHAGRSMFFKNIGYIVHTNVV